MIKQAAGITPFLKWAGGKRWLSESLTPYLTDLKGTYFEPFLGSGAVFFRHLPKTSVLSDANQDLIDCYLAIRDNPGAVSDALNALSERPPEEAYYDIRNERPTDLTQKAARFLYLNRTCWNGLYRVNLRGEFNVPRGTKTQIILTTDDFPAVSAALKGANVSMSDFEATIDQASDGDVVFADPPYTVAHNNNGFVKYNQTIFSWNDQIRLAHALRRASERGSIVISTNADHPEVKRLYNDGFSTSSVYRASIIAASSINRRKTSELFITNDGAN